MCVGNACGGMSVTTIYPASHGDPGFLMFAVVGIMISVILVVMAKRYNTSSGRRVPACFGIFS